MWALGQMLTFTSPPSKEAEHPTTATPAPGGKLPRQVRAGCHTLTMIASPLSSISVASATVYRVPALLASLGVPILENLPTKSKHLRSTVWAAAGRAWWPLLSLRMSMMPVMSTATRKPFAGAPALPGSWAAPLSPRSDWIVARQVSKGSC